MEQYGAGAEGATEESRGERILRKLGREDLIGQELVGRTIDHRPALVEDFDRFYDDNPGAQAMITGLDTIDPSHPSFEAIKAMALTRLEKYFNPGQPDA